MGKRIGSSYSQNFRYINKTPFRLFYRKKINGITENKGWHQILFMPVWQVNTILMIASGLNRQ